MPRRKPPNFTLKTRVGDFEIEYDTHLLEDEDVFIPSIPIPDQEKILAELAPYFDWAESIDDAIAGEMRHEKPSMFELAAATVAVNAIVEMCAEIIGACKGLRQQELGIILPAMVNAADTCIHTSFQHIGHEEFLPEDIKEPMPAERIVEEINRPICHIGTMCDDPQHRKNMLFALCFLTAELVQYLTSNNLRGDHAKGEAMQMAEEICQHIMQKYL